MVVGRSRAEIKLAMRKASFASRSEAARYAANQRWKGNVKEENDPDNPVTEAGKEAMRLGAGLAGLDGATNSTPRGVQTPVFYYENADDSKDVKFGAEVEARAYLASQKLLYPEAGFYLSKSGRDYGSETLAEFPNGSWTVGFSQLAMAYVNNDVRPVDPSRPHSWEDIRYVRSDKRYSINPETNEHDEEAINIGPDAVDTKPEAMIMNTSPKNPAGLNREGLIRWERSSMVKFSGYAESNYCDSLGYYASIYAGYGEPFPRPDNSYRIMHKVTESKLEGLASNLVDSLRNADAQPTLWRGIGASHQEEIKNGGKITSDSQVGDTFTVGLGATSRSLAAARFYATPYSYSDERGIPTLMRIRAGSQGLALSPKMSKFPHDQEVLTGGKFKIVSKEVVNLSQKARRVAEQRMRIADVQRLPLGTRGRTDLLEREQTALALMQLKESGRELFTIIDVEQVSV